MNNHNEITKEITEHLKRIRHNHDARCQKRITVDREMLRRVR